MGGDRSILLFLWKNKSLSLFLVLFIGLLICIKARFIQTFNADLLVERLKQVGY